MHDELLIPKDRKGLEKRIRYYQTSIWVYKIGAVVMIPLFLASIIFGHETATRLLSLVWMILLFFTTPAGIKASRNLIKLYESKLEEMDADQQAA
jgi:hypothetical protein